MHGDTYFHWLIIGALFILVGILSQPCPLQHDTPSFDWRKEHCHLRESAKQ